jgi:hypothetical protein
MEIRIGDVSIEMDRGRHRIGVTVRFGPDVLDDDHEPTGPVPGVAIGQPIIVLQVGKGQFRLDAKAGRIENGETLVADALEAEGDHEGKDVEHPRKDIDNRPLVKDVRGRPSNLTNA